MVLEEFEENFFKDEKPVQLEFTLFHDQWEQLHNEIMENGWSNQEAIQYFLTIGLRTVHDLDQKEKIASGTGNEASLLDEALQERLLLESRYAVMRFRAYQFMQAAKTLEMKYNSALVRIQILENLTQKKESDSK
ncbi:hypothetical protein [Leptolinea tardivitalis]|uniref:Uncharacterized protein n=1 Tax=Leptolinea tardivitalis TaxID=229920 RepID=A0A0P6WPK4_9CHLR|nr:hypothetical protein [Leptolinea tardivitalis]KPL70688.1 hypothetical protein ADM99_16520 [Leptolinea tardivitalis]GAP22320.1 hypothetical protein LTAR_02551 [Leptolinea tardivitalis]